MSECSLVLAGEQRNTCLLGWAGEPATHGLGREGTSEIECLLMFPRAVASSHSTVQGKVRWVPKDRDEGEVVNWRESNAVPYSLRLRIGRDQT